MTRNEFIALAKKAGFDDERAEYGWKHFFSGMEEIKLESLVESLLMLNLDYNELKDAIVSARKALRTHLIG